MSTIEIGECFLIPSGSGKHLFVVCTRITKDGFHLLASVSSIKSGKYYDPSCVLEVGAHEFVTKRSFVDYSKTQQMTPEAIHKQLKLGYITARERMPLEVVEQINAGFEKSDRTRPWVFDFLDDLN